MKQAPWNDYAGNPIYESSTIKHPSGQSGVVIFVDDDDISESDKWLVDYDDGESLSRLCLQVGDKGMAEVKHENPNK